jgi:hypothetical protein
MELVADTTDKHLKIDIEQLNRRRLRDWARNVPSKVYCAYRVTVTLKEQVDGVQLDLGPISKAVPLEIRGKEGTLKIHPKVNATITGVLRLLSGQSNTKIDLGYFAVTKGNQHKAMLYAPHGFLVTCDDKEQMSGLTGKLKELDSTGSETRWSFEVTIAPRNKVESGQLPKDAAVLLRVAFDRSRWQPTVIGSVGLASSVAGESMYQSRLVRIPIAGTAESR